MKEITFSVDSQKLSATIQYPQSHKDKNPAILMVHGWMSSQKGNIIFAQALIKLGFIVMTFDLRSHGSSEGERGKLSREDYMDDMEAAYDLLASQKDIDATKIGVIGSSFGSYLATILTSRRDVSWLALRVPAQYPDEGFNLPQVKYANAKTTAWRKEKLSWKDTQSLRAIHDFAGKVLIIESELDVICPHQTMENYMNAVSNKKNLSYEVIQSAEHSLKTVKQKAEFTRIMLNWLQNDILIT